MRTLVPQGETSKVVIPSIMLMSSIDPALVYVECRSLCGVSWPSGLVHRTQVLVLSENQNVGSIPGSGTCVLQQDT